MKNAYWVWRTKDPLSGHKAFHIIADWDVNGAARTDETYPVFNLHEIAFKDALRRAEYLGFTIKLTHV